MGYMRHILYIVKCVVDESITLNGSCINVLGCGLVVMCQDRDQWWAVVNIVMNIWVPVNVGIS
jgi:hypothetical protein